MKKIVALALALIMATMTPIDFLILDEPTNHLDMESITALNNGLIKFPGVILFASRDHQVVQTTANRIIEFLPDGTDGTAADFDYEGGHQGKQLLPDAANLFLGFVSPLVIDMNLMSQGKQSGADFIPGFSGFIVYVITVAPGEYPLPDVQLHNTTSFDGNIPYENILCKKIMKQYSQTTIL